MKKLLPLIGAVALVVLLLGPARPYLPSALRLQIDGGVGSNGGTADVPMDHGKVTGIGLAPAPVVNPPATAARLSLAVEPLEKREHGYSLTTSLLAPDGKPLADTNVKFYDLVDLFGQREMLLATETTDGRGVASYDYLPARTGTHQIVVRFSGREGVRAGEARTTFEASVAAPAPQAERNGLAAFSDRLPYGVGALVLAVWGLIAFALFATARGVIAGARRT